MAEKEKATQEREPRIGVYVCHCGINIAHTVDVRRVAEAIGKLPNVVVSETYPYMCSDPGQNLIKEAVRKHDLTGVVVAACSPRMHEPTFRTAVSDVGINPYMFDMANIREQCSWIHDDTDEATAKAIDLVRAAVARASHLAPLTEREVPVTPSALVVGGGIAGIQAALDIADAGYQVHLVEKEGTIGGHMAQLDKTFPTLDCSACILTPRMVDVSRHPNIDLMTYSELADIQGYVGNFTATVRQKPRYVDLEKCTNCGLCYANCPIRNVPQLREPPGVPRDLALEDRRKLDEMIAEHGADAEQLIQILQDVNVEYNYLPADALKYVGYRIGVPPATIYHVASFYTAFSLEQRGRRIIKVCMGTACHARGAVRVLEEIERTLGIGPGETTADMEYTLLTVNCLGCCALGPVVVVDNEYHSVSPGEAESILALPSWARPDAADAGGGGSAAEGTE
jgi:NADH:ubiquinone oxidoreductase subunit E/NAD-dependent dihydropyrimidine dehydrogenase PreA subunit